MSVKHCIVVSRFDAQFAIFNLDSNAILSEQIQSAWSELRVTAIATFYFITHTNFVYARLVVRHASEILIEMRH